MKTHAKLALVVRKEEQGLRSYVHIGTGNYHVRTARLYADVGLFTCNPAITGDVIHLFHYLTGHSEAPFCKALLAAPQNMRQRYVELIRREIANRQSGLPARIVAKMNQLEDPELIQALCDASNSGVPVDLIVRGFCCLRPESRAEPRGFAYVRLSAGSWSIRAYFISPRAPKTPRRASSIWGRQTGCIETCPNAWR